MSKRGEIIDAEYEVIRPRSPVWRVIEFYASILLLGFWMICSMIAVVVGIMWIALLVYTFFWSLLGALVCIVGGFIMFVWAGASLPESWKK